MHLWVFIFSLRIRQSYYFLTQFFKKYTSAFLFQFFFWKNRLEGTLTAGLAKVPVKVKLLIKKERRANYVKNQNIEHIRSLDAEKKKN